MFEGAPGLSIACSNSFFSTQLAQSSDSCSLGQRFRPEQPRKACFAGFFGLSLADSSSQPSEPRISLSVIPLVFA